MANLEQREANERPPFVYKCGLRPGDRVRLRKDLVVRDRRGVSEGEVHPKGEIWTVLPDSCGAWHDLWLQQADGQPHTWDDEKSQVDEWFELVSS